MRSCSTTSPYTYTYTLLVAGLITSNFHAAHYVSAMPNHNFRNAGRVAPFGHPDPSQTFPTGRDSPDTNKIMISSRCSCGSVLVQFPCPKNMHNPSIIDCHCALCRRFHVSAFVRYMALPEIDVSVSGDSVVRLDDSCSEIGPVRRMYCRRCSSKLLTTPINGIPGKSTVLVNMGPIENANVPNEITEQWKNAIVELWRPNMEASWTRAVPLDDYRPKPKAKPSPLTARGGCTCGTCQYEFEFKARSEMQHCYCNLCRQLSGGMFMTWVPVAVEDQNFRWITGERRQSERSNAAASIGSDLPRARSTSQGQAPLVRFTDIGQRHVCSKCGGVLSILYDCDNTFDEDAVIWLAAAGFDSIRFPFNIEPYLDRMLHICCRFKPDWYTPTRRRHSPGTRRGLNVHSQQVHDG